MTSSNSTSQLITATDETADLYHMSDVAWVEWVYFGWFAVGAVVAVWILTLVVKRQRSWLPLTMLGIVAVGLIAGGLFLQIGQPATYLDDDGQWACPTSLNAMRITEANGLPLSDGIVECRADAKRDVAVGATTAAAGLVVAICAGSVRKRSSAFA